MKLKRKLSIILTAILAFASANAKIAIWDIPPHYEKLIRYYDNIFAFRQNGKWGLVQRGNNEIIPASCDYFTPFINGYALACIKKGNRHLLHCIINEDGSVTTLTDRYYLHNDNKYQYVSEGKLVVSDNNGKYGYISPDGRIVIKCQFEDALPFKEGWASVRQGNYTKYITENYDTSSKRVLIVDFHNGEMTLSSCFQNGMAVVAYNKKYAIIGKDGQVIRNLNKERGWQQYNNYNNPPAAKAKGFRESNRYTIIRQNEKYGLKDGEDTAVIPQFDSLSEQFNDSTILTMHNGRYGLLKITEGEIIATTSSDELEVDKEDNLSSISIDCSIPASLSRPKLFLDLGDGIYKDFSSQLSRIGSTTTLTVTPIAPKNAKSCDIKGFVENDGIKLADFEKSFSLNYPIILRVSKPGPDTIRAAANDSATFYATIFNNSNRQVRVTATWSTGEKDTVTIPANGSKVVDGTIYVPEDFTRTITIKLSTSERVRGNTIASKEIVFLKYF